MNSKNLRLTEAMKHYEKQFKKGTINILNAPPACGKTTFIFNEFLNNTSKYISDENKTYSYKEKLNKILYVCDTRMLKDSILSENSDITDLFNRSIVAEKDQLIQTLEDKKIKIMTYSSLGWFMENARNLILDNFDIIIADEIHNLFKYCKIYNTNTDEKGKKILGEGEYITAISSLNEICQRTIFIAMTGTTNPIYKFKEQFKEYSHLKTRNIFTPQERKTLFTYNYEPIYTNCILSRIKSRDWKDIIKKTGYKIFIYTRTIKQSEKYKQWFEMNGLKAEWLCSINNKKENKYIDIETGEEITEKIPTMTDYKMEIRNRLLYGVNENNYLKGTVPDDLDVLIVNGGYETGWNLLDERFQIAFIDTTDLDEQEQARYRIRNDIRVLECLYKLYDEDGMVLTYGQYGEIIPWEVQIGVSKFKQLKVYEAKMRELDEKYIGIKLTTELKEEIKFMYGVKNLSDRNVTWTTIKRDLKELGYIIETFKGKNNGTYIFKKGKEIKKDSKKVSKKMDKLIKFLKENNGKRLDRKGQDQLKDLVNSILDGEILKTPNKINNCFEKDFNIKFIIIPKKSGSVRQWLIESIEE